MMLFYTTGNMNFSLYSPHFLLLEITWKKIENEQVEGKIIVCLSLDKLGLWDCWEY